MHRNSFRNCAQALAFGCLALICPGLAFAGDNVDSKTFCGYEKSLGGNPTATPEFAGWPLYVEAINYVKARHLKLQDPAVRQAFEQEWLHKYDASGILDNEQCADKAINTMLESLEMRFDHYIDPKLMSALNDVGNGKYRGLGFRLAEEETAGKKELFFNDVIENSPAWIGGIRPGDALISIAGESVVGRTVEEADALLKKASVGAVNLEIVSHAGRRKLDLLPGEYAVEPVTTSELANKVAYIKLREFMSAEGNLQIKKAIEKAGASTAIVLDLRRNPGGTLDNSLALAEIIMTSGIFSKQTSRVGDYLQEEVTLLQPDYVVNCKKIGNDEPACETAMRKQKSLIDDDKPIVVLIDESSASASEIIAGTLQSQRKLSKVVGMPSRGKGEGQDPVMLSDERGLLITTFTFDPGGRPMNWVGVIPDVQVKAGYSGQKDLQLEAAHKVALELISESQKLNSTQEQSRKAHKDEFLAKRSK